MVENVLYWKSPTWYAIYTVRYTSINIVDGSKKRKRKGTGKCGTWQMQSRATCPVLELGRKIIINRNTVTRERASILRPTELERETFSQRIDIQWPVTLHFHVISSSCCCCCISTVTGRLTAVWRRQEKTSNLCCCPLRSLYELFCLFLSLSLSLSLYLPLSLFYYINLASIQYIFSQREKEEKTFTYSPMSLVFLCFLTDHREEYEDRMQMPRRVRFVFHFRPVASFFPFRTTGLLLISSWYFSMLCLDYSINIVSLFRFVRAQDVLEGHAIVPRGE